jgi:WD40 repeat protein
MKIPRGLRILAVVGVVIVLLTILASASATRWGPATIPAFSPSSASNGTARLSTPSVVPPTPTPTPVPIMRLPASTLRAELAPITATNAGRVMELARLGRGWPSSTAYSPDGSLLAIGTSLGVELRTADSGQVTAAFSSNSPIMSLAFSPDGKWLAAGRQDGRIVLYDPQTGSVAKRLDGQLKPVHGLAFSHPAKAGGPASMLASGDEGGTIVVWDLESAQARFQFSNPLFGYWGYGIRSLAFSRDDRILATGGDQGYVALWNLSDGKELPHLKSQHGLVFSIAFSPDGKRLASACGDGTVQVWDFAARAPLFRLSDHEYGAWSLAYSPDGKSIATGAGDGLVRLWDAETGALQKEYQAGYAQIDSIGFSKDGLKLAVVSIGQFIQVFRTGSFAPMFPLTDLFGGLRSAVFSADGDSAALTGENGVVYLWNATKGELTVLGGGRPANRAGMAAVFSPDGGRLVVVEGAKESMRIFNADSLALIREERIRGARAVGYSPDGAYLAAGGLELVVQETASEKNRRLDLPTALTSLAFLQARGDNQTHLAAGLDNGGVILWDLKTGENRELLAGEGNSIWCLAAHEEFLAAGDNLGGIRVWNLQTDKLTVDISGNSSSSIFTLAISPDGSLFAAGGKEGVIRIYNLRTGRLLSTLKGHNGLIYGLDFSPDGKRLLSAGADGSARIWGVQQ